MKRWIQISSVIFVSLLVAIFFVFYFFLGSIVKGAIEKVGPQMTKTSVQVLFVGLSPLNGSGKIRGFSLGNPAGFDAPIAIQFDTFKVNFKLRSFFSDVVVIQNVLIDSPQVTFERGARGSNIAVIQKNVEAFTRQFDSGGEKAGAQKGNPKKIIIRNLQIRNATATLLGAEFSIPDIQLKDLGSSSGGISPAEAVGRILSSLTQGIAGALPNVGEMGKKAVEGVGSKLKGLFGK